MASVRNIWMVACLLLLHTVGISQEEAYKNFYGICWRGKMHDNLLYARNMGYKHVFYQKNMEKDSLSNGLFFFLESPEYLIYNRTIQLSKKYTTEEIRFYENYCATKSSKAPFPMNMATGWFVNDSSFSVELDLRKEEVRKWAVKEILLRIKQIEGGNNKFRFAGLAWDVPQLSGDFWSAPGSRKGHQVTLSFWDDKEKNVSGESDKYAQGRKEYYKLLFSEMKRVYPNARTIMEPYRVYDDWIKQIGSGQDAKSIMPDILCQEEADGSFIYDNRIFSEGMIQKNRVASTTPNIFSAEKNLVNAGQMAVNGAWFSWFGRFGGTGDMPDYKNVYEVPARIRLIRAMVNWENLNETPLAQRSFKNNIYKSTTAGFSKDVLWGTRPGTRDIYCTFLSDTEGIPLLNTKNIHIYMLDSLMSKGSNMTDRFIVKNKSLYITNKALLEKPFLIQAF